MPERSDRPFGRRPKAAFFCLLTGYGPQWVPFIEAQLQPVIGAQRIRFDRHNATLAIGRDKIRCGGMDDCSHDLPPDVAYAHWREH